MSQEQIRKSVDQLRWSSQLCLKGRPKPRLAIVLGSGFGPLLDEVTPDAVIPYSDLPGFPTTAVPGHAGRVVIGELAGTSVIVLGGRAHYYEGYSIEDVTFATRVLAVFGIRDLILTNAAGAINGTLRPGDFMLLADHINFMGVNPLRGAVPGSCSQFVDMSCVYDPQMRGHLLEAARQCGLKLTEGVYLALSGPSYETPAEIRAFARLGADVVGMSTVPEALVARQHGMRVAGISCITNLAAGLQEHIDHGEIIKISERVKTAGVNLLKTFIPIYNQCSSSLQ